MPTRFNKPVFGTGLDASHPTASDLVALYLCNEGAGQITNLVDGYCVGGAGTWTDGESDGNPMIRDFSGTAAASLPLNFTTGSWSVACWVFVSNLTSGTQPDAFARYSYTDEFTNQGWALGGVDAGNSWRFMSLNNNGSYNLVGGGTRTAGEHFLVGTTDGATRSLYVDGSLAATTTTNASSASSSSGLGNVSSTEQQSLIAGYGWRRCLNLQEVQSLYFDPFPMIQRRRRRVYSIPPGGTVTLFRRSLTNRTGSRSAA